MLRFFFSLSTYFISCHLLFHGLNSTANTSFNFEIKIIKTLKGHTLKVTSLLNLPHGDLMSASDDGHIIIWNLTTGQIKRKIRAHNNGITNLILFNNNNINEQEQKEEQEEQEKPKNNSIQIVSGCLMGQIRFWNLTTTPTSTDEINYFERNLNSYIKPIDYLKYSSDHEILFQSTLSLKIFDLRKNQLRQFSRELNHKNIIITTILLNNGRYVATGSADTLIKIWNINGTLLKQLKGHRSAVSAMVQIPNNNLVSSSYNGELFEWDLNNGSIKANLSGLHLGFISFLQFSNNNRYLMSGDRDGKLILWDWSKNWTVKSIFQSNHSFLSSLLLPNGRDLAIGQDHDPGIAIWRIDGLFKENGQSKQSLTTKENNNHDYTQLIIDFYHARKKLIVIASLIFAVLLSILFFIIFFLVKLIKKSFKK